MLRTEELNWKNKNGFQIWTFYVFEHLFVIPEAVKPEKVVGQLILVSSAANIKLRECANSEIQIT